MRPPWLLFAHPFAVSAVILRLICLSCASFLAFRTPSTFFPDHSSALRQILQVFKTAFTAFGLFVDRLCNADC